MLTSLIDAFVSNPSLTVLSGLLIIYIFYQSYQTNTRFINLIQASQTQIKEEMVSIKNQMTEDSTNDSFTVRILSLLEDTFKDISENQSKIALTLDNILDEQKNQREDMKDLRDDLEDMKRDIYKK